MLVSSAFRPPAWLANCHIQTLIGSWIGRDSGPATIRERLELADGDFIDLDWLQRDLPSPAPTLVILHGLEGSIHSSYIQGLLAQFTRSGWRVVVMHFRGCSGELNRLARNYHSGDTADLHYLVSKLHSHGPLAVAGFSLGGNVLLKYLGEQGSRSCIQAAVAVSVPFNLGRAAVHLDQGMSRFYRNYLLSDLKQKTLRKRQLFTDYSWPDDARIKAYTSFTDFDHEVTAPLHGFTSGSDYYERCSSLHFLKSIDTPTLVLQAKDDPFLPEAALPDASQLSGHIQFELSEHGGHVGFIDFKNGHFQRFLDARIKQWLADKV